MDYLAAFVTTCGEGVREHAPADALLARLGGDEFVIVAELDTEATAVLELEPLARVQFRLDVGKSRRMDSILNHYVPF